MVASTKSLAAGAWKNANTVPGKGPGLNIYEFPQVAIATSNIDEANDIIEHGYLPIGLVIYGLLITSSDVDTGGPGIVYKATVTNSSGTTDIATGITIGGTALTGTVWLTTPYTTTEAYELLATKITTQATTPAIGTMTVRIIYSVP